MLFGHDKLLYYDTINDMSIIIKYNKSEHQCNTILWDRDSFFIDFNCYWSRLIGTIAQKVAENTTNNWNNFTLIRTHVIRALGINLENDYVEPSSPVNIFPLNIFPSLLASTLQGLLPDKKLDELNDLFQIVVDKALNESQTYIKGSIILKNVELVKQISINIKQILITNDSKENNNMFLKESGLQNCFHQVLAETNKEQLYDLLKGNTIFLTKNSFLKKSYLKRGVENILKIEDINTISFDNKVDNDSIVINIDGASRGNPGPSAVGIVFYKNNELLDEFAEFIGNQTNNFAEYTALIRALELCLEKDYRNIEIKSDSELVVNQINKIYKVKDAYIKELFDKANSLITKFPSFKINYIPREENLRADKLANNALKKNSNIGIQAEKK